MHPSPIPVLPRQQLTPSSLCPAPPPAPPAVFPSIYEAEQAASGSTNPYCVYNNQMLSLFTSSLFIAGLLMAPVASWITRRWVGG